jgi:hypothetical protein
MSEIDAVDHEALIRAIGMARKDPALARQLDAMLANRPWDTVAKFAAYWVQSDTLQLRPWEEAPCHGYWREPDGSGGYVTARDEKAGDLADKLKEAGLSIYEPDPIRALKAKAGNDASE